MSYREISPQKPTIDTYFFLKQIATLAIVPCILSLILVNLTPVWTYILDLWPYDHATFFVVGTIGIHAVLYYGINGFFLLAHYQGWLKRFQIERGKGQPFPERKLIVKSVVNVTVQLIVFSPLMFPLYWFFTKFGSVVEGIISVLVLRCMVFKI
eukprot:TRINITY_DN2521_c0_g1_i1.p1 TRINITY_DN2521_c0_g1~~TRINITY_DN2521_c0_g1_i1.p1  ORF type:complete len:154 (-),score=1.55 TRINITY_DN2521_c0_g1_i1:267-728(-)